MPKILIATPKETAKKNLYIMKIKIHPVGDQLDLLYKDLIAGKLDATGEWAKAIKAVKDANPKE